MSPRRQKKKGVTVLPPRRTETLPLPVSLTWLKVSPPLQPVALSQTDGPACLSHCSVAVRRHHGQRNSYKRKHLIRSLQFQMVSP